MLVALNPLFAEATSAASNLPVAPSADGGGRKKAAIPPHISRCFTLCEMCTRWLQPLERLLEPLGKGRSRLASLARAQASNLSDVLSTFGRE